MKQLFVDTSAWYAFVNQKDPDHSKVSEYLRQFRGILVTSNFVFDEVVTLVLTRTNHTLAAKIGNLLMDSTTVVLLPVTEEDQQQAWRFFKKMSDKNYSFTDCTSFILMKRLYLTVALTLDSHFTQAGFHRVP